MDHPTTRVLTVLELLQTYGQVSGPDVARRLGVSERTVRHYIALLRDLGYPVETARGRYGAYRLRPGAKLPPLLLAEDEGLALVVGLLAAPARPVCRCPRRRGRAGRARAHAVRGYHLRGLMTPCIAEETPP